MKLRCWLTTALASAVMMASSSTLAQQDQSNLFPVPEVEDALSWRSLGQAEVRFDGDRARVVVPEDLLKQEGETVKAVGFLLPLSTSGDRQFLMETSPHCPFCLPITRESLIELTSDEPIGFFLRAVVVEGRFDIADDTVEGSLYRMTNVELLDE
jgi:hypothetical protein